jgi:hypothetical protein
MSEKTLSEVDAKIAQIRDQMAAGKASINSGVELDALMQERAAFLAKLTLPREREIFSRP